MFQPHEVECTLVGGGPTTTVIRHDSRRRLVTIKLGGQRPFTIAVRGDHIDELVEALREGDSRGVPGWHRKHGERLLGVHPHQWWEHQHSGQVPMELYLILPDDEQLAVVFTATQLDGLIDELSGSTAPSSP
jgi:hypothetical protein